MFNPFNYLFSICFIWISDLRLRRKITKNYGSFAYLKDHKKYSFPLSNESLIFCGEITKIVLDLPVDLPRVFLPGENNISKEQIRNGLIKKLGKSEIITAGLSKDVDYRWNFEDISPQIGKFSLIISQAMLEHLIDPYKHIKDLADYLVGGGYLIVHTALPGFMYHRYPVDTLRFYPDWFEEIAKPNRCNLRIVNKYIRDFHIFYVYEKN